MIKKILIGIGVLLIAVLVGAGWYFSGLIYEIGFNVNNRDNLNAGTSEDIIFVEEIKEDSVVLNVQNERWGPLLENGIYGVIGANGFIIVNDIISSNDGIVERKILLMSDEKEAIPIIQERKSIIARIFDFLFN